MKVKKIFNILIVSMIAIVSPVFLFNINTNIKSEKVYLSNNSIKNTNKNMKYDRSKEFKNTNVNNSTNNISKTDSTNNTNTIDKNNIRKTISNVNFRSKAEVGDNLIFTINSDEVVEFIEEIVIENVSWSKIKYKGKTGFVSSKYLVNSNNTNNNNNTNRN